MYPYKESKCVQLKRTCDYCVKMKRKCDGGRPFCDNCKKKGKEICHYSLKKKPGRKQRSSEQWKNLMTENVISNHNQNLTQRDISIYTETYITLYGGTSLAVERNEIEKSLLVISNGKWEKFYYHQETVKDPLLYARFTYAWSILSIGAHAKGNCGQAQYLAKNSSISIAEQEQILLITSSNISCDRQSSKSTIFFIGKSALVASSMYSCLGLFPESSEQLLFAEKLAMTSTELLPVFKHLRMSLPCFSLQSIINHIVFDPQPNFWHNGELDFMDFPSQVFYQWAVALISIHYHSVQVSTVFDEAYFSFLLAREEISKQSTISPICFGRIEICLSWLEIFHVNLIGPGLQRLKATIDFLYDNGWFILTFDRFLLTSFDIIAFAMHFCGDEHRYDMVARIWNSTVVELGENPMKSFNEMVWQGFSACEIRKAIRARLCETLQNSSV